MTHYIKGECPQELNFHLIKSFWVVDEGFWGTKQAWWFRENISPDHVFVVPGGERAKSWIWLEAILETLCLKNWPADRALVGLGGGAVLDLSALAAHLYKRGMPFVSIPTTTLAMVDASLGGKSALNCAGMKNMIGAYHEPIQHYQIDSLLGEDLKAPWVIEGMSEAYKHGLIANLELCEQVVDYLKSPKKELLHKIIEQAALVKLDVVEKEKTDKGVRNLLNLGHTCAHGFEAAAMEAGISLSHGSAVALGLCFESYLMSGKLVSYQIAQDLEPLMPQIKSLDLISSRALICMRHDKKGDGSTIAFTRFGQRGQMMLKEHAGGSFENECWIQRVDCDKLRDCWKQWRQDLSSDLPLFQR